MKFNARTLVALAGLTAAFSLTTAPALATEPAKNPEVKSSTPAPHTDAGSTSQTPPAKSEGELPAILRPVIQNLVGSIALTSKAMQADLDAAHKQFSNLATARASDSTMSGALATDKGKIASDAAKGNSIVDVAVGQAQAMLGSGSITSDQMARVAACGATMKTEIAKLATNANKNLDAMDAEALKVAHRPAETPKVATTKPPEVKKTTDTKTTVAAKVASLPHK